MNQDPSVLSTPRQATYLAVYHGENLVAITEKFSDFWSECESENAELRQEQINDLYKTFGDYDLLLHNFGPFESQRPHYKSLEDYCQQAHDGWLYHLYRKEGIEGVKKQLSYKNRANYYRYTFFWNEYKAEVLDKLSSSERDEQGRNEYRHWCDLVTDDQILAKMGKRTKYTYKEVEFKL